MRYGFQADHSDLQSLYDNTRQQGFGAEARRRIEMGNFVLSRDNADEFFTQAQKVRRLIAGEFERAFEQCDVLVVPTVATLRPKSIEAVQASSDPIDEWSGDLLTVSASLAGLPAISVPVAMEQGFPVSLQVIGPRFADARVLQVAEHLSQLRM